MRTTWWEILLAAAGPLVGGVAAMLKALHDTTARRATELKAYAELLKELPNGPSKNTVAALIDQKVSELAAIEQPGASRSTSGAVGGGILLVICASLSIAALGAGGWWLLTILPLAIVGGTCAYGLVESLGRVPRDEKGRRLKVHPTT